MSTDASNYAPGDAVTVTVSNSSGVAVSPGGGIVCQGSPWPFALQVQDDAGNWNEVASPRTPPCVGIAAALLQPGQRMTKTLMASADPGEYRLSYAYHATDGSEGVVTSDPFTVGS